MGIIQLKEANCKNCYKCIRECPVKAISFKDEQARVIEKECILCGKCILVCPQNAKEVVSHMDKVKSFLNRKDKVYVSLAPSYASYFNGIDFNGISSALKKLGFLHIEETAVGAAKVSAEYDKLIREGHMENVITTACPTVVLLVEKYYPELIPQLAPVVSPLMAHAKTLREVFGNRIKIIFIGPCISKKYEVDDMLSGGLVNAAITFEELKLWFEEEGIDPQPESPATKGIRNSASRFYPMPGGIIRTIPKEDRKLYKCISVDGVERCQEILDAIKNGEVSNHFIEMNACTGACLGGPCMKSGKISFLRGRDTLIQQVRQIKEEGQYVTDDIEVGLQKRFMDRSVSLPMPDEEEILKILSRIGKTRPEQELNCGGCGYTSCREKAVAVYQGKADPRMCLPFVRERAERLSNLIIDYTPNAILALDSELNIQEVNPAALTMLKCDKEDVLNKSIYEVLPCSLYEEALNGDEPIQNRKMTYEHLGIVVEQSIIYIREQQLMLLILKNITNEEKHQQSLNKVREETLEIAQKVIDKQMRVAQEIASLLGETTAETKTALTKLKKSILMDAGDSYEYQNRNRL